VISSISNWLTNRRIVWIAAAIAFLGFTGPGLFGLSPPQFFQGHDAVTEQAKIDRCAIWKTFGSCYRPTSDTARRITGNRGSA
jgi:hypothetical protein